MVSFLGGDPDRPLCTGSVYNADQTVPYALPGEQTKSTLLSRSSKGGSAGNELRFEDRKDSEELFMHAQKDMVVTGVPITVPRYTRTSGLDQVSFHDSGHL